MLDHLRQMAIFAKVIDHGSFRGAARELRLSPSVVSHHISELEDRLGVALLYRTTRKLTLTPEGAKLLAATRRMLEAVEDEIAELSLSAREPSGELRITAPSVLSLSPLLDSIAAFSRAHPRIRLSLDFSDTRKDLIDDGFDLAVRFGPAARQPPPPASSSPRGAGWWRLRDTWPDASGPKLRVSFWTGTGSRSPRSRTRPCLFATGQARRSR